MESFGVVSVEVAPCNVVEKDTQARARLVVLGMVPGGALPGDAPSAALQAHWLQHTEVVQLAEGGRSATLDHPVDVVRWTGGCATAWLELCIPVGGLIGGCNIPLVCS